MLFCKTCYQSVEKGVDAVLERMEEENCCCKEQLDEWLGNLWVDISPREKEVIKRELARNKGEVEAVLYDDPKVDDVKGVLYTLEKENPFDRDYELIEMYISDKKKKDSSPEQKEWLRLKAIRSEAWEEYIEAAQMCWLELDVYEDKVDTRLRKLICKDEEPTSEQWEKVFKHLSYLRSRVQKTYTCKYTGGEKVDYRGYQGFSWKAKYNDVVYPLYKKAWAATHACRDFWKTDGGKKLSDINSLLNLTWELLVEENLVGKLKGYNHMINEQFNLWNIWGKVSKDTDKPSLKNKDRLDDVPEDLWYQIIGMSTEDHYHVCIYG